MRARDTLFALLLTAAGAGLAGIAAEAMLVSDLAGRLDASTRPRLALAETTWSSLPFKEAISWFRKKQIMLHDELKELEDGYASKGFTVAGLKNRHAIEQVHGLLSEALQNGTTRGDFLKGMDEHFTKWKQELLGRNQLELIFDTQVVGAYAAGRYKQMARPDVLKERPYWQYKTVGDNRVRPTHQAMHNRVFAADDPIWDEWYPPNGYRCRCSVVTLSKADVEGEGLEVQEEPPRQIEDKGQVYEMLPDPGFSGSPRTQARADAVVEQVRKATSQLGLMRAPEITRVGLPELGQTATGPARPPVFSSAGDLLRMDDARRTAKVDAFTGLSGAEAEAAAKETPFFNVFQRGQLSTPPSGEAWVEVPVYSQNLDTAEQLARRLAGKARMGHLAERIEVVGRASYGEYETAAWSDPEVAWDAKAGERLGMRQGNTLSRSTEIVLRIPVKNQNELKAAQEIALQTEQNQPGLSPVRRAWQKADIRIRGEVEQIGKKFSRAFLNRRDLGAGEQVVLSRGGPIPGWTSEPVAVNRRLYRLLPSYPTDGKGRL